MKTLCVIDLRDIHSDGWIFAKIKSEYFSRRKPSSSLYLRKPTGIDFIKASSQPKITTKKDKGKRRLT
jgi:hypothetical protein